MPPKLPTVMPSDWNELLLNPSMKIVKAFGTKPPWVLMMSWSRPCRTCSCRRRRRRGRSGTGCFGWARKSTRSVRRIDALDEAEEDRERVRIVAGEGVVVAGEVGIVVRDNLVDAEAELDVEIVDEAKRTAVADGIAVAVDEGAVADGRAGVGLGHPIAACWVRQDRSLIGVAVPVQPVGDERAIIIVMPLLEAGDGRPMRQSLAAAVASVPVAADAHQHFDPLGNEHHADALRRQRCIAHQVLRVEVDRIADAAVVGAGKGEAFRPRGRCRPGRGALPAARRCRTGWKVYRTSRW